MKRRRRSRVLVLLLLLVLSGGALWYSRLPCLTVYLDEAMAGELDSLAYRAAFFEAGVYRVRLVQGTPLELGRRGRDVFVGLKLSSDRNPQLDESMLAQGLTGPGFTIGWVGHVYRPDVELFVKKHAATYKAAGIADLRGVKTRMITNTAVHETWHAVTQSTSHNPDDKTSVMYLDPGKAALEYGTQSLRFTRGHRDRIRQMFRL